MSLIRMRFFPSFLQIYLKSFHGLPSIAWKGIMINGVQSIFSGVICFLTLYFVNYLKFSVFQSGIIISCYGVGTIVGAFLGGKLSDQFSPGKISLAALFLESIAFLMLSGNHHFYFLMINLLVIGVSTYSFMTSNTLWILERCHDSEDLRLKALNILNVGSNLGLGLSAIFIGFLYYFHFQFLFIAGSVSLFSMGLYFFTLEKNFSMKNITETKHLKSYSYMDKKIIYVLFSLFCMGIIISQTSATYSLFLTDIFPEMGIKSFSILFAINTIMVVLFQTILVDTLKSVNKVYLLSVSIFFLGLSMLILRFSFNFSIAIFSVFVMTIGEILFFSISQFICYEKSTKEKKGQNLGIYRMIYAMSRIVGPFLGGFIFQEWGSAKLWYFCFGLSVICVLPLVFRKVFNTHDLKFSNI